MKLVKHFILVSGIFLLSLSLHAQTYISATGGTVRTEGNYKIHTFTSSDIFSVTSGSGTVEVLVVAGGGGGGGAVNTGHLGCGGGGGTVIHNTAYSITAQAYSVVVGGGGVGSSPSADDGTNGGNSIFGTITATGGTYVSISSATNQTGGSNGNYAGGTGGADQYGQTGGGGAGGGSNGNGTHGGDGFLSSISGTATYYAGGGGGAGNTVLDYGGQGGGGNGGSWANPGQSGAPNTGGGGGGNNNAPHAGNGGSGIVIIRYQYQGTGNSTAGTGGQWNASGNNIYFQSGNVSIGTDNAQGYRLAVNGDAIFTKIKVKNYSVWPDYVFGKDYKRPSLTYINDYLKKYKHLPDIPAADQIQKGAIDVGQMQGLLLKKIEELTLIVIQQDQQIRYINKKLKFHSKQIK